MQQCIINQVDHLDNWAITGTWTALLRFVIILMTLLKSVSFTLILHTYIHTYIHTYTHSFY